MTAADRSKLKEVFHAQGFVVVRGFMDEEFLRELERQTDQLAETRRKEMGTRDIHFTGPHGDIVSSMHNLTDYLPLYADFIRHTELKDLAAFIFGEPISDTVFNSSYFAKPAYYGIETKVHQDNAYFHLLPPHVITCWFGLDSSDETNGGLYYYEGSWKLGLLPHSAIGELGASQAILEENLGPALAFPKRFLILDRGDVVMHNPLVVHGSPPNKSSRSRRGFNFSFATTACRRDEAAHGRYQSELAAFLQRKKQSHPAECS